MIFRGHMTNRWYAGLAIGRWILFTIWTNPIEIQGPSKTYLTRD